MNRLDDLTRRKYIMIDAPACLPKSNSFKCDSRKKRGFGFPHNGTDPDAPRQSFRRYFSDDVTTTRSVSTNPANPSVSPALSSKAPRSEDSSGTLSHRGHSSASQGAPRHNAATPRSSRVRRQAVRDRRRRSGKGSDQPVISFNPGNGGANPAFDSVEDAVSPWKSPDRRGNEHSRCLSDSVTNCSAISHDNSGLAQNPIPQLENKRSSTVASSHERQSAGDIHAVGGEKQWNDEVHKIFAGLVMVEGKCIELCRFLSESQQEISQMKWIHLSGMHRTLLSEYHDFYVASLHPIASPLVMGLAEKYQVPARMWHNGIFGLLNLQESRQPDSTEHMLSFIYYCYSLLTLFLETTAPKFERVWMECLGDLSRYRMSLEVADSPDWDLWAGIARYWYNKAADRAPDEGRIQHHMAVLFRHDIAQRLFFYTKALVSVNALPDAKSALLNLFNSPCRCSKPNQDQVAMTLVGIHGQLFTLGLTDQAIRLAGLFLSNLEMYIGRMGAAFRLQGVYIMSTNFAAIFEYGKPGALLPAEFNQPTEPEKLNFSQSASERWTPESGLETVESNLLASKTSPHHSRVVFTSSFAFQTVTVILDQIGDKNVYPTVHFTSAFIWCLASTLDAMKYIEAFVPWSNLAVFLNTLIRDDTDFSVIESERFPLAEGRKQVPEDFCIRGLSWSRNYYPPDFFAQAPEEDDGRWVEMPSLNVSRAYRCLWLGVRIAQFNRWLVYDSASHLFSETPFALELDKLSRKYNRFHKGEDPKPTEFDEEMHDV